MRYQPAAGEATGSASGVQELKQSGATLLVSVGAFMLLSAMSTHLPSLILLDVTASLGISTFEYTMAIGVGNLIKAGLLFRYAGAALERFGAHRCALAGMALSVVMLAFTATCPSRVIVRIGFAGLVVLTTLGESPAFVCLNASHFNTLLSFATSVILASFSISGAVVPVLLAPILSARGWRAAVAALLVPCVLILPAMRLVLQPGPLAVGNVKRSSGTQHGGETAASAALATPAFRSLYAAIFLHMIYGSWCVFEPCCRASLQALTHAHKRPFVPIPTHPLLRALP